MRGTVKESAMGPRIAARLRLALDWHLALYPSAAPTGALLTFRDKVVRCEPLSDQEWEFKGWRSSSGESLEHHHLRAAIDEIESALSRDDASRVQSQILCL